MYGYETETAHGYYCWGSTRGVFSSGEGNNDLLRIKVAGGMLDKLAGFVFQKIQSVVVSLDEQVNVSVKGFTGIFTFSCLELTGNLIRIAGFADAVWDNNGLAVHMAAIIASPDGAILPGIGRLFQEDLYQQTLLREDRLQIRQNILSLPTT